MEENRKIISKTEYLVGIHGGRSKSNGRRGFPVGSKLALANSGVWLLIWDNL